MPSYANLIKNKKIKKISNAALQVCKSVHKRVCLNASLTIEAALSFTLFMFAMAVLILPFDMMYTHRRVLGIAEAVARDASQYAYTLYRVREKYLDTNETTEEIASYVASGTLGAYASARVMEEIDDVNMAGVNGLLSECLLDGEMIKVELIYDYKPIFSVFSGLHIPQRVVASRRAWIGNGKFEVEKEEKEGGDEIVYVGKNPTRYHMRATCHYLYNDIKTVSLSSLDTCRNTNGAKYKPCERCGSRAVGNVYVMPAGTHYHSTKQCSAIGAYVRAVKKTEVEHLGVCSYCGGK